VFSSFARRGFITTVGEVILEHLQCSEHLCEDLKKGRRSVVTPWREDRISGLKTANCQLKTEDRQLKTAD
jgi:hypothetical protein